MTSEVMVALLMSVVLKLSPSTTTNMKRMAESPTNHEASEMQISFISSCFGVRRPVAAFIRGGLTPRLQRNDFEQTASRQVATNQSADRSAHSKRIYFFIP